MRLRNKMTGEIVEYDKIGFRKGLSDGWKDFVPNAESIAELNEEWEDLDATIVRTKNRIEFLERKLKFEKTLLAELCGKEEE